MPLSITFTVKAEQAGHEWLILRSIECYGIILSNCVIDKPFKNLLAQDTTLCYGDSLLLRAAVYDRYN